LSAWRLAEIEAQNQSTVRRNDKEKSARSQELIIRFVTKASRPAMCENAPIWEPVWLKARAS
jgi:hypothetical protein